MTKIRIGKIEATLVDTTWHCAQPAMLRALTDLTALISVGAHVPDVEEYICLRLAERIKFDILETREPAGEATHELF